MSKRNNMLSKDRVRGIKTALVVIAFALILFSFLSLVVMITLFAIEEYRNISEVFYWITIGLATICLCILPLMNYYNGYETRIKNIEVMQYQITKQTLNEINELFHSKTASFVQASMQFFYESLNSLERLENFHKYSDNNIFYDSIDTYVNVELNKKNDSEKNPQRWQTILIDSITRSWKYYTNLESSLENASASFKYDTFITSLLYILNKFEVVAYDFLNANLDLNIFVDENFKMIDDFYVQSYYIIRKLGYVDGYEKLDSMCRMIFQNFYNN